MLSLTPEQEKMLHGEYGRTKQMAMRLLVDMAATAGATELVPIHSAHLSGVSPLTGGLGLRQFLRRLAEDVSARVAVPTTLNAAGCDANQFAAMRIAAPNFREQSLEIVALYQQLGVQPTQSCTPYEWEGVNCQGTAAWAESNAIAFGNSYCGLLTNRESGLSALASALTGFTPKYGLLEENGRLPNLRVYVTPLLSDPTDFSILGDWIGKQRKASWQMPLGPIPLISGLPAALTHEQKKALTAAAANYGCPLLYIEGEGEAPDGRFQDTLTFSAADLAQRYADLRPRQPVSLVAIGCPQASVGELRAVAELLRGQTLPAGAPPLWVFTSAHNKAIAERTGLAQIIRASGALLLENTCPEVVPYDPTWVRHVLTNSMKAEHYIRSGLNGIPTSVMKLADCVAVALGKWASEEAEASPRHPVTPSPRHPVTPSPRHPIPPSPRHSVTSSPHPSFTAQGRGLPSQGDFCVVAEAFVTDAPITFLGFVNRETAVIEEEGHPANGQSMAGKIAIFPKGSGSTVAPYVLLELFYRGVAPAAIVNTDIDQQSAPACSLEGIPYAYGFDQDVIGQVNSGDVVELRRSGEQISLRVIARGA